jgi:NitT/TauT family transport system substrate-binding protein
MKPSLMFFAFLLLAIVLSECGGSSTPGSNQNLPVIPTAVQNATQSPSGVKQATIVPIAQEMTKLKMTISQHSGYAPFFIAQEEGYFKDFGIDLEFVTFNKTSEALALLIAGNLDIFTGPVTMGLLNVIGQEENIKAVADRGHTQPGDCTYQAIVVRKDLYDSGKITKAADLKGQTIATSPNGPDAYLLSTYLTQAGLTMDDVVLNDIPSSGNIDAFKNKTLAVNVPPEPDLTLLMKAGDAVILAREEDVVGVYQFATVVFNKKLLVDNRDAGIRFLAAYLKAVRQYNQGKTERNLQILSNATGETTDLLKQVCWVALRSDGQIDYPSVDKFQQWSIQQELLENAVSEAKFMDPSLVAAAVKLLNR